MHVPEGLLSNEVAIGSGAIAAAAIAASMLALRKGSARASGIEREASDDLLLPVTAAFVFATQMLNFPVGPGVSAHFLGAAMAAVLLGPLNAALVLALVLVPQAFIFADGGVTPLGANIVNMGVIGGLGAGVLLRVLRKLLPASRVAMLASVALASWFSVVAATVGVCVMIELSGKAGFWQVFSVLGGFNALAGIGEAVITVAAIALIARERPDLIRGWPGLEGASDRSIAFSPLGEMGNAGNEVA